MSKKRVIQVGSTKETETSLAALGSSGITPDQQQVRVFTPEDAEFHLYSELLRTFDKTMQRWRASVCIPEYFTQHHLEEDEPEQWQWMYRIAYPPTNPSRIVPKKFLAGEDTDDTMIGVQVLDGGDTFLHDFFIEAMCPSVEDPYTGEDLGWLKMHLKQAGKPNQRLFYALSIKETVYPDPDLGQERWEWDRKLRNVEYFVGGLDTGKPNLSIEKSYGYSEAELLSEPHALALFNLMDKFIPPRQICIVPQPEHRASQELGSPMKLPARRTRHPGR